MIQCNGKNRNCYIKRGMVKFCRFKYPFYLNHWDQKVFCSPPPLKKEMKLCFKKYTYLIQMVNILSPPFNLYCHARFIIVKKDN